MRLPPKEVRPVWFPVCRLFLAFAVALLLMSADRAVAEEASITAPEASALVSAHKLTLIDLRTPEEWRQTGVPTGAKRVDMRGAAGPSAFLEEVLAIVEGDRSRAVALICRTGNRSAQAQKFLLSKGFTNVVDVKEGVMGNDSGPGWLKRGLPVEACPQC